MNSPKVSIIVPVYNVENTIERCLESLVKQTYKNIEILLINDGSQDNSLNICEEYKNNDNRIKIINQENKGLSGARNTGLNIANGDYICFVDSDDWVEKDFVQYGINLVVKNNVKLAILGYYNSTETKDEFTTKGWISKQEKIITNEEAMRLLVEDETIKSHAWDKIYSKELFKKIRFPENKNFEDIYIMHKIVEKCEKIVLSRQPKYHYYIRENSISRSYKIKNIYNYFEAEIIRRNFLEDNYKELKKIQNTKLMELLLSYKYKINYKDCNIKEKQTYKNKFNEYERQINKLYNDEHEEFFNKKYKYLKER